MDASTNFPEWAPAEAISIWQDAVRELKSHRQFTRDFIEREKATGTIPDSIDTGNLMSEWSEDSIELAQERMLCRLLTYECMREAWASVKRSGISARLTALTCRRAFFGPMGSETKPPVERERWLDEVQRTAAYLAKLIQDSPLDDILIEKFQRAKAWSAARRGLAAGFGGMSLDDVLDTSNCYFPKPSRFSGLLLELSKNAKKIAQKDLLMCRPGDPDAKRAYFVKHLTAYFRETCGKPLRTAVANFTSVAFECDICERQVIRLAP